MYVAVPQSQLGRRQLLQPVVPVSRTGRCVAVAGGLPRAASSAGGHSHAVGYFAAAVPQGQAVHRVRVPVLPLVHAHVQQVALMAIPVARAVIIQPFPVRIVAADADVRLGLVDLPAELIQEVADWLPTFGLRAGLRALCSEFRAVEWRRVAPCYVKEELCNFRLGDPGAIAISAGLLAPQNACLKELSLGGNGITDEGAVALAMTLATGRTKLHRLSLRDNCIGDRGALALAEALATASTLEELDLWGNDISEDGQRALLAAASSCEVFLELPKRPPQIPGLQGSFAFDPITRFVLFDWIAQVQQNVMAAIECVPDPQSMLLRSYSHVDAYLAQCPVQKAELELVGLACTLVSTGLGGKGADDEPECLELANWLAFMTDGAYTADDVCQAARDVRGTLGSSLHQPTVYTFLRRYLRQTGWSEASFSLANYLVELAALDASFLNFRPQVVAAAAAILSRQYMSQGVDVRSMPHWKARLRLFAGVDMRHELAPCAAALSKAHARLQPQVATSFVHHKYTSSSLCAVAKLTANPPAGASFFETYMMANVESSDLSCS